MKKILFGFEIGKEYPTGKFCPDCGNEYVCVMIEEKNKDTGENEYKFGIWSHCSCENMLAWDEILSTVQIPYIAPPQ